MIEDADATGQGPERNGLRRRERAERGVLGAVLLAFATYVGFDLVSSRRAITATELDRLEHQAGLVRRNLTPPLQSTVNALDAIRAELPSLLKQGDGISLVNGHLKAMVASVTGVRTFALVDSAGVVVASNRPELVGRDLHETERYRTIAAGPDPNMLYMSPPFESSFGDWVLSVGRVIVDDRGRLEGALFAIIDPQYWHLLLDSTRYAPDAAAAMIHSGGKVIFRIPDPRGAVGLDLSGNPDSTFSRHIRSGKDSTSRTATVTSTGLESLIVLQNIRPAAGPGDGFLVVFLARETSAIYAPWRREAFAQIGFLIGVALVTILALAIHQRRRSTITWLITSREAERRRAEESQQRTHILAESEKRYRMLADNAQDVVWVLDLTTRRLTYVSPSVEKLRGVTVDEALRETMAQSLAPESLARVHQVLARVGTPEEEDPHTGVYELNCKDGSTKHVEITTKLLREEAGRATQVLGASRDVTSRVKAETALRESEASLRAVFDLSPDATNIARVDGGGYVEVNEAFAQITGWSRDDVLGRTSMDLGIWDDPADRDRMVVMLVERGIVRDFEARFRTRTGRRIDGLMSARLMDYQGHPAVLSITRDVTDWKRSELRYRLFADHANDVIWMLDLETLRFTYVSPSIQRLRGLSVEEALAEPIESSLTGESLARVRSVMARIGMPDEEDPHTSVYEQPCRDGSIKHVEITTNLVRDQEGRPVEVLGVSRDATARVRAERDLEAREVHFRRILDALPIPMAFANWRREIVTLNTRFTTVLGYTREDMPTLDAWFHKAYRDEGYRRSVIENWDERTRKARERGTDVPAEDFRVTRKDGTVRTMSITGVPIGEDILVTLLDVTEARSLQAQLGIASRLAAMGTLVAGVAHEINNPLAAELADQGVALEVIRQVRERLRGDSPLDRDRKARLLDEAVDALEEAQGAGQRIAGIVRDLTTFGRPDATRRRARLVDIVEGAMRWLTASVSSSATVSVENLGAPDIEASFGQVEQVVVNLVTNAARATPEGARDRIIIRLGTSETGMARMDVIDHGKGIPSNILDRIFEPFFTTRPTGPGRGTGLGLAICHAIATSHGGRLTVESEVGKGSTFTLELPAAPAEA
jgi:PAS domain S-box-containing protein